VFWYIIDNAYICRVKLLCTILALLVLTLSVQPACASVVSETVDCCANECTDVGGCEGDHDDACKYGCNPFQVCGCCAFCVVIPAPVAFFSPAVSAISTQVYSSPVESLPQSYPRGFLKPPRI
jgi:hypothetical protein